MIGWGRQRKEAVRDLIGPNGLADVVPTTKGVGSLPPPERYLRKRSDSGNRADRNTHQAYATKYPRDHLLLSRPFPGDLDHHPFIRP